MMLRRGFMIGGASLLGGCKVLDGLGQQDTALHRTFVAANDVTYRAQRALLGRQRLAREYTEADIRQPMRPNGSTNPDADDYLAVAANSFADYRLEVKGLVETPLSLSLDDLKAMGNRTQITRHDCVEGWSCIAKWTGTPLGPVVDRAKPQAAARFVVFRCYDAISRSLAGPVYYYESIDLIDAHHPQTILAWGLNDKLLPVTNGAPLRVRVERQLGYKMAKYLKSIELVDSLDGIGDGYGGYWPDNGYDWYAGI